MLIAITEVNHWEHEKWTYLLDADLQGAAVINELLLFVRLANKQTDEMKEAVLEDDSHPWVTDFMGRRLYKLFAASNYWTRFYDEFVINEHMTPVLIEGKRRLQLNGRPSYRGNMLDTTRRISSARLHSAVVALRDAKEPENKLYKDFDSVLLKKAKELVS